MKVNHAGYKLTYKHFQLSIKFIDSIELRVSRYFYHFHRLDVKLITIKTLLRNYPASQHIRCLDMISEKTRWVHVTLDMILDIRKVIGEEQ
jgi:hypothetical protein